MLNRYAKKHTIISFSIVMLLSIFACVVSADNTYAVNNETACSQVPQSEAEYCIDMDKSFNGRSLRDARDSDSSDKLYASIKVGSSMQNAGEFGIIGETTDNPTNYYYATNETPAESNLPLMITGAHVGLFIYTTTGAIMSISLALVDSDGYMMAKYNCSTVGTNASLWSDENYIRCSLPASTDGLPTIPKRGATLRLYFTSQLPEYRKYVEPEPDPESDSEPADDEAQEENTEEIENVDTIDEIAKEIMPLVLSIVGVIGLAVCFAQAKRV